MSGLTISVPMESERTVTGMAKYIDKFVAVDKLIRLENEFQQYKPFSPKESAMYQRICETEIEIVKMQPADVAPVRHGRWIDRPTGRCGQWQAWCSACDKKCGCGGTLETQHKIFCPNCGARMDRGIDNG